MKLFGSSNKGKRIDKSPPSRGAKGGGFWRSMPKWAKITSVSLLTVIVLLSALAVSLRMYVRLPPADPDITLPPDDVDITPPDTTPTVTPSGELPPPETPSPTPPKVMKARSNVYSFILAGQHDGLTDTLMVALLDAGAMTLNIISIPRDTIIKQKISIPKINSVYSWGGSGAKGMDALRAELRDIIGFSPANYMLVSMKGFVKLVDTLGGVNYDVPMDMYVEFENIDLKAGYQPLDGEKALMLMRFRGYGDSDYGRMKTQQKFLTALAKKILSPGTIVKIPEIADIFAKNVISNLDVGEMGGIGELLMQLKSEDIHFYSLPTVSINYKGSEVRKEWYEMVNTKEALELINRSINPYTEDITEDMVNHILLQNP